MHLLSQDSFLFFSLLLSYFSLSLSPLPLSFFYDSLRRKGLLERLGLLVDEALDGASSKVGSLHVLDGLHGGVGTAELNGSPSPALSVLPQGDLGGNRSELGEVRLELVVGGGPGEVVHEYGGAGEVGVDLCGGGLGSLCGNGWVGGWRVFCIRGC